MKHPDPRLRAYCDLVVAEPTSVTAVRDPARAWEVLVEDALAAVPIVRELAPAEAVDVGSGGGSPGIPLAVALDLDVTLLEATGTKCRFLERAVAAVEAPMHGRPRAVGGVRPRRGSRPVRARVCPRACAAAGRGRAGAAARGHGRSGDPLDGGGRRFRSDRRDRSPGGRRGRGGARRRGSAPSRRAAQARPYAGTLSAPAGHRPGASVRRPGDAVMVRRTVSSVTARERSTRPASRPSSRA